MKNKKTYAASRAHVWAFCEPSETLTKAAKNPFKKATPEQSEGVAIHAAIHAAFDDRVTLTPAQKEIIAASDDAESVIEFCVNAVRRLMESNPMRSRGVHFESVVDYEDKNLSVAARPDLVLITGEESNLIVVDFKTGYVPVEAEGNEQLKIYAHAFAAKHNLTPTHISGVIIQPRLSVIDYAEFAYEPDFFERLHTELKKREGRYVVGAHCKNCQALTTCRLFRETAQKWFEPALKDGLTSRPEEWQKLIAIARPMKKFAEEILDETKNFLEMGGALENVGLTKSAGKRAWFREITPAEIAEKLGVPLEKIVDAPKIKTPAQAEKVIPREAKERLRALVYQPQNLSVNLTGETNFLSDPEGREKVIRVASSLGDVLGKKGNEKGNKNGKKPISKKSGKATGKNRK
jgi:hypothetical protein